MSIISYETVPGFFLQDDPHANSVAIGAIPPRFGLICTTPNRWSAFKSRIAELNQLSEDSYKVFFFGRHGEGFHNVGLDKYGAAWTGQWSKLDGDDELTWGPDAELTSLGEDQARAAHEAWVSEFDSGIPLPEKLYCSPLTRALRTHEITFDGVIVDKNRKTLIIENLREEYGEHTCDKRRTRTYIADRFVREGTGRFEIEEGFTEEDELWKADEHETKAHVAERAKLVLDRIFDQVSETMISVTAHAGMIRGFEAVLGREQYELPTGGVLPMVIKRTQK